MSEIPSRHPDLKNQTLLRLNEINEMQDYFITENYERDSMSILLPLTTWTRSELFYLQQVVEYLLLLLLVLLAHL